LMLDQQGHAPIGKAAPSRLSKVDLPLRLAQQKRTAGGRNQPGGKTGLHSARKMSRKSERFLITLCHQKGPLRTAKTTLRHAVMP
jgi:hypothetical protein